MLTLVDSSNLNHPLQPEQHGLYRLSLRPSIDIAVANKPVFGANITFHSDALAHSSYIATPENILGWVDHGGITYFNISSGQQCTEDGTSMLPSQFLTEDNGILRFTTTLRVYLLANTAKDIQQHGLCFFTPV